MPAQGFVLSDEDAEAGGAGLPTAFNCPAMRGPLGPSPYRVVYTARSRQWPAIAAAPLGCWDGGIVVGKHRQPALDFSRGKILRVMLSLTGQRAE
jgi:hypothetical protein